MTRFRNTFLSSSEFFYNPSSTPDTSNMSEFNRIMTSLIVVDTFIMHNPITILNAILGVQNTGQDLQHPKIIFNDSLRKWEPVHWFHDLSPPGCQEPVLEYFTWVLAPPFTPIKASFRLPLHDFCLELNERIQGWEGHTWSWEQVTMQAGKTDKKVGYSLW